MKKIELNIPENELISKYKELKSCYKVGEFFNVSSSAVKRVLKSAGVLRTQKQAALERDSNGKYVYKRTDEHRKRLSELAKSKTGNKNPFFGKKHSEETKNSISEAAKKRLGKLNPNYKNGKYQRRPRDFKIAEFSKIRNFVFNRDKHTCQLTGQIGGNLHAHHILPYWVCPEAFLDAENLMTVSTKAHFEICHNNSWGSFNVDLVSDVLLNKYSLNRERLNELASIWKKR